MRVMTTMWGLTFVADALIHLGLVFLLTTSVFLVASQVLFYGMFALTLFLTIAYGRRAQRKAVRHPPVTRDDLSGALGSSTRPLKSSSRTSST